ncbi:T9SS type A sorting domain-containing protein [Dokdonia sp.]|uniref:T9SS type A sorting domain-containing protein n=1 Tax=Dokdonia sp. TaxID=2024995 RepID=UPI0032633DF6
MKNLLLFFVAIVCAINLNAQEHLIEIHPEGRVASLLMEPSEYNNWIINDEFNNATVRHSLFQDIYQYFEDDFDFVFLILNEDTRPSNLPFGQLINVSNDIEGIGKNIFNNSPNYGSNGQLKAVMHLTRRDYLRAGPSLHEIMHNWGNSGIYTESVSATGDDLSSFPYIPHWGFTGGSNKGQLGGFDQSTLIENGENSYTVEDFGPNANGGNSVPYSQTELYLMGMIPITDIDPFDVFTDITSLSVTPVDDPDMFHFEANDRTTYTPELLESTLGIRNPSYIDSQKDFKLLVLILTDTPLSTNQWNLVNDHSEKFGRPASDDASHTHNFWEATNGVGSLETGNLFNSLGINDITISDSIRVYPIPVKDQILIDVNTDVNINSASLYNILGQNVGLYEFKNYPSQYRIDMSNYPSGTYYLKLNTDKEQIITKKIIKN